MNLMCKVRGVKILICIFIGIVAFLGSPTFAVQAVTPAPTYSLLEEAPSLAIRNFWTKLNFEYDIESALSQVELAGIGKPLFIGLEPKNPMESMEEWNRYGEWGVPQVGFYLEKVADSEYEVRVPSLFQRETDGESGFQFRFRRSGPPVAATEPFPQFQGVWGRVLLGQILEKLSQQGFIDLKVADHLGFWEIGQSFLEPSGKRAWLLLQNVNQSSIAVTVSMTPTVELLHVLPLGVMTHRKFQEHIATPEQMANGLATVVEVNQSQNDFKKGAQFILLFPFTKKEPITFERPNIFYDVTKNAVFKVVWSPDGSRGIFYSTYENRNRQFVFNQFSGAPVVDLPHFGGSIDSAGFSPDGTRIAITESSYMAGANVHLLDAATGKTLESRPIQTQAERNVPGNLLYERFFQPGGTFPAEPPVEPYRPTYKKVVVSQDGTHIAEYASGVALIREVDSNQIIQRIEVGYSGEVSMAFSYNGKFLAIGSNSDSNEHPVHIWDVASGVKTSEFHAELSNVQMLSFSPNGKLLAVESKARRSRFGETTQIFKINEGIVLEDKEINIKCSKAVFSPDSKFVAGKYAGRFQQEYWIGIWELDKGQKVENVPGKITEYIGAFTFAGNSRQILIQDKFSSKIVLWKRGSKNSTSLEGEGRASIGRDTEVAVSSDGKYLVMGARDGLLRIWDLATNKRIAYFATSMEPDKLSITHENNKLKIVSASNFALTQVWSVILGEDRENFDARLERVFGLASRNSSQPVFDVPPASWRACSDSLELDLTFDSIAPRREK